MFKFVVVILALVASIAMGATPTPSILAPVTSAPIISPNMAPEPDTLPPVVPTVPDPSPQMAPETDPPVVPDPDTLPPVVPKPSTQMAPEPTAAPAKKTSAAPADTHVVQIAFLLISSMVVMMW